MEFRIERKEDLDPTQPFYSSLTYYVLGKPKYYIDGNEVEPEVFHTTLNVCKIGWNVIEGEDYEQNC